ncbi:MAG: pantoate--beta-alanine ligase [Candidatus Aminicenantes bacterium RBG_13_62_12]|nr:MAG: pantoate--beta-alanine ligase [Candidatus Aminicenantes bacterium RBG_13_62_12]
MRVITSVAAMKSAAARHKAAGRTIGLVPTMGYLHEGHLSLVRASKRAADATVVSIFVNPSQFGPREDLKGYPRDFERDARLLRTEGTDILFHPRPEEMYPPGYKTYVEVHDLQNRLCGISRPTHFRGVCTIVLKLFSIVRPDRAFFGQKDAQQAVIIRKMARDLDLDVRVDIRPIVREPDGLALSSRNVYLSPAERRAALVLTRSLKEANIMAKSGERRVAAILTRIRSRIASEPLARLDYAAVVDPETLEPLSAVRGRALVALAVFIGRTRLIDNVTIRPGTR